ncbi:MAG TPA: hypothetical protein VGL77_17310, partial [Armatimonadota bacterium]
LDGEVATANEVQLAGAIAKAFAPKVENLIRVRAVEKKPVLDLEGIQRSVGADIKISSPAEGILLLEGKATADQKARLTQIIQAMGTKIAVVDMVATTTAPRQIMVRVKVAEINKSALSELGIEWGGLNAEGAHDQPILFGESSTGPFKLDQVGPFRRLEGLSARLKALVTTNRARILAEPNLLVVEQQKAEILVGGEIPIPVVQNGDNKNGAVSIEWKEFGVKLALTASIGADGQSINLDVMPEVSNLDFGNAVIVSNILLPALQTRRVHSMLHIMDRQTLVIGGLYQVERSNVQRKVPLLGDIPLLGNLFKRTDKKDRETELMIFVTPEIVTDASITAQTQDALNKVGGTTNADTNANKKH